MINESIVQFKDNGGDLEKALTEFKVCIFTGNVFDLQQLTRSININVAVLKTITPNSCKTFVNDITIK